MIINATFLRNQSLDPNGVAEHFPRIFFENDHCLETMQSFTIIWFIESDK